MKHVLLVSLVACSSPATQPPPVTPATPPPVASPLAAPPAAPSEAPPARTTETTIDAAPIESDAPFAPKPAAGPVGGYGHGGGFGTITNGRYGPVKPGHVSTVSNTPPQPHTREKIAIRHEIKKHIFAIQACYDKALDTKPDLAGTVNATFTIEPDGRVSSASASGVDPDVATCVAAEVKTIQFPTADAKTVVNYPFMFRPATPTP